MTVSDNIFHILEEKNISQKTLAERTGIPQSTISDWKHKRVNPGADKILVLSDALGVTPYELLRESEEDPGGDVVLKQGTEEYFLLECYRNLKAAQKARLLGYLEAIRDGL